VYYFASQIRLGEIAQILAFYSFKGGVGRSMAVLNLAYSLAAKGRHVLVLDMDLEAPGLRNCFKNRGIASENPGNPATRPIFETVSYPGYQGRA
jgi:cellulose biosynthesis protein BcsQ